MRSLRLIYYHRSRGSPRNRSNSPSIPQSIREPTEGTHSRTSKCTTRSEVISFRKTQNVRHVGGFVLSARKRFVLHHPRERQLSKAHPPIRDPPSHREDKTLFRVHCTGGTQICHRLRRIRKIERSFGSYSPLDLPGEFPKSPLVR